MILYESSSSFLRGYYPPFGVCLVTFSASYNMSSLILLKPGTSSQREMRSGIFDKFIDHFTSRLKMAIAFFNISFSSFRSILSRINFLILSSSALRLPLPGKHPFRIHYTG